MASNRQISDRPSRRLHEQFLRALRRVRGAWISIRIRTRGGHVGARLEAEIGVRFRHPVHNGLSFGDDVYLGHGVVVDIDPKARLHLGNRVKIMHYVCLAASLQVEVGDDTQIAERTSIRDSDHGTAADAVIRLQPLRSTPVVIGADVWVGCNVAVLRGARIGDGAVIGANSVVKKPVPKNAIAVGAPVRIIGDRSRQ